MKVNTTVTVTLPKVLWQEAIDVQNACNLSGVLYSLRGTLEAMRDHGITSTGDLNSHPITRLYVAKLADLAGLQYEWPTADYTEAIAQTLG